MKRFSILAGLAIVVFGAFSFAGVLSNGGRVIGGTTSFNFLTVAAATGSTTTSSGIQLGAKMFQFDRWHIKIKVTPPTLPAALSSAANDTIRVVTYGYFGGTRIKYDSTQFVEPTGACSLFVTAPSTAVDSFICDDLYFSVQYADSTGDSAGVSYAVPVQYYFVANGK